MAGSVMSHIVLHLARSKTHPQGSASQRYEIVAPLDAEGRLDAEGWQRWREKCTVLRIQDGVSTAGKLTHRAGGAGGSTWVIDYDDTTFLDDESGYRLGSHRLVEGEYVSIRDESDEMHTFRVVSVAPEN